MSRVGESQRSTDMDRPNTHACDNFHAHSARPAAVRVEGRSDPFHDRCGYRCWFGRDFCHPLLLADPALSGCDRSASVPPPAFASSARADHTAPGVGEIARIRTPHGRSTGASLRRSVARRGFRAGPDCGARPARRIGAKRTGDTDFRTAAYHPGRYRAASASRGCPSVLPVSGKWRRFA